MTLKNFIPDRAAVIGCAVGMAALSFGWFNLKPNRLASGTSLRLWESLGWVETTLLLCMWLSGLAISLNAPRKSHSLILGIILNLIVVTTLFFSGLAASRLLSGETSLSRVALSGGVWITLVSAYVGILACSEKLTKNSVWNLVVSWSGLIGIVVLLHSGWLNDISLVVEVKQQQMQFIRQLGIHIVLFSSSVFVGALLGIPLGFWARRHKYAEKTIFFIVNITQTIPSLALFGLLIAPLSAISQMFPILRQWGISGVGTAPAIIALILYSLLPVVRNTYSGLKQIDPAVIDAGKGMGMSKGQVFRNIELPLATPIILDGVRTSAVQAVGNTAVAALIGAGGLGWFIFQGISQASGDTVIIGAIPIMALAIIVDVIMQRMVKISTPKGIAIA